MWQMDGFWSNAWTEPSTLVNLLPERIAYATERYVNETKRLYAVLDKQLFGQNYVAGEYSIADMAIFPWILRYEWQQININDYPNVKAYMERIQARPAVQRALALQVN